MKKIILLGAAPIHGRIRFPSEGAFAVTAAAPSDEDDRVVTADDAAALIEVGLATSDDLEAMKVDEVRQIAADEGADVPPDAVKADVVDAIRANRQNEG